jgi:hypothetical protein
MHEVVFRLYRTILERYINMALIDIIAAAEYTGLTPKDIKTATKHRQLACVRPSPKKTLYSVADLDAWRAGWQRVEAVAKGR